MRGMGGQGGHPHPFLDGSSFLSKLTRQVYSLREVIVVKIETRGIEPIPASERHGRSSSLFTLWFAANLGVPPWFLGVLLYSFGLGLGWSLFTVLLGNLVGSALVALPAGDCCAVGGSSKMSQVWRARLRWAAQGTTA